MNVLYAMGFWYLYDISTETLKPFVLAFLWFINV